MSLDQSDQRFELLADLGAMLAGEVDLDELLATFAARVAQALGADRATLWLVDAATGEICSRVATLPEMPELRVPPGTGVAGHVAQTGELVNIRDAAADPRWARRDRAADRLSRRVDADGADHPARARSAAWSRCSTSRTARSASATRSSCACSRRRSAARSTTRRCAAHDAQRGLTVRGRFNRIIGRSPAMAQVYELIVRAAQTDATVLLRGETGTGKGLFARAIHVNCARRDAPFVNVDCTTLPAALVESELFGHERGAFTGADARVPARSRPRTAARCSSTRSASCRCRSGQAAALPAGARVRARRRPRDAHGRRARRRGDAPRPRGDGERRPVPRGPLLPDARRRDRAAAAARARRRGHRAISPSTSSRSSRAATAGPLRLSDSGARRARRARLAGQRARARELDRERGRARLRPDDRRQGPRARAPRAAARRLADQPAGDAAPRWHHAAIRTLARGGRAALRPRRPRQGGRQPVRRRARARHLTQQARAPAPRLPRPRARAARRARDRSTPSAASGCGERAQHQPARLGPLAALHARPASS